MSNKSSVVQEIMCFELIGRVAVLMDQFCAGLKNLGVLPLIRAFPDLFGPVLVYTACICPEDVVASVYTDGEITPSDAIVMTHLRNWLNGASEESKMLASIEQTNGQAGKFLHYRCFRK